MGLIRKMWSVSTLGAVDFRSDKERIARYTRQTRNAVHAGNHYQQVINPIPLYNALPQVWPQPGWYLNPTDPPGYQRWWDGQQWTPTCVPVG